MSNRSLPQQRETRPASFRVEVAIDLDLAAARALRRGVTVQQVVSEICGDLECTLHDSIRWNDVVASVGVKVLEP